MKKKCFHLLIAAGMSLTMMFLVVVPVNATTISDLEREKQELEQQAEDARDKQGQEQKKLMRYPAG